VFSVNQIPQSRPGRALSVHQCKGRLHELCGYTHDLAQLSAQSDLWETTDALSISRRGVHSRVQIFLSFPFTAFSVQHCPPSFRALQRNSGTKPLGLPRESALVFRHLFVSLSYTTSVSFYLSTHCSPALRPCQPWRWNLSPAALARVGTWMPGV
jgi:hypothetical protein